MHWLLMVRSAAYVFKLHSFPSTRCYLHCWKLFREKRAKPPRTNEHVLLLYLVVSRERYDWIVAWGSLYFSTWECSTGNLLFWIKILLQQLGILIAIDFHSFPLNRLFRLHTPSPLLFSLYSSHHQARISRIPCFLLHWVCFYFYVKWIIDFLKDWTHVRIFRDSALLHTCGNYLFILRYIVSIFYLTALMIALN